MERVYNIIGQLQDLPLPLLLAAAIGGQISLIVLLFISIYFVAPVPRSSEPSEKTYRYVTSAGQISSNQQLPCWIDKFNAEKEAQRSSSNKSANPTIEPADILISVVVPAYNEQDRLEIMLTEAVEYLEKEFSDKTKQKKHINGAANSPKSSSLSGYEILVVSDGSTDATVDTALRFAQKSSSSKIRVVTLVKNRGKGGAVTHGLRHVRGAYVLFADADGASRFSDLGSLVKACQSIETKDASGHGRGVAIGSRAHLVGSEAVVKRAFLRNLLMHGFHLFLRLLTSAKTAKIRDTQCGFKLFSRNALSDIVPYMHSEGWIFDVEMLMLAESAGIEVAEVPVDWHEVTGSKLNVIKDSLAMAWGLTVLRLAWAMGIYSRV